MAGLPWETGAFMPWNVGQYYTDGQGVTWQVYSDPASPSGYTLKRVDSAGTSYQVGPTPNDPNAAAQAFEQSPYGQRLAKYELGLAQQNEFQNQRVLDGIQIQKDTLKYQRDVAMMNARTAQEQNEIDRWYKGELVRIADADIEIKRGGLDVQRGQLGLSTLQLGANLRGPENYFQYQRTAAGASQNPLLTGAVDAWASLTNNRPSGLGAWGGGDPTRFSMGTLASDFTGGPAGDPGQQAFLREADMAARNPNQLPAGWWESKNDDQQKLYMSAWDELGHSSPTVLNRYQNTRINQGITGSRAA